MGSTTSKISAKQYDRLLFLSTSLRNTADALVVEYSEVSSTDDGCSVSSIPSPDTIPQTLAEIHRHINEESDKEESPSDLLENLHRSEDDEGSGRVKKLPRFSMIQLGEPAVV